ncbi:MAG: hypothetical protein JOY57_15015 [Actinobacteria bacterium]|nr:hypothetical protein [Actinomycetota bacterium]
MARRVIRTEYVDDDAAQPRVTEVVEPAPAPRRRTSYIEDEGPYVAGTRSYGGPAWGMPVGVMIGLAVVAFLLLMLLLGHV